MHGSSKCHCISVQKSILVFYDLYMIYRTNSRSTFAVTLLVVISCFLFSNIRINKLIISVCALFPVLFVVVYLYLYYGAGLSNFSFMNKTFFSGRQVTYLNHLSTIENPINVLFGNFGAHCFQNAENAPLAVFCSVGVIGLIAFYAFYLHVLFSIADKPRSQIRTTCLICILGLFIESSTEASFFLGGFPCVILVSTFMLLGNYMLAIEYPMKLRSKSHETIVFK